MRMRKLEHSFGVEFDQVDVNRITDTELDMAREAQNEHGVVFFRDQKMSCDQHINFANRLGDIVINRFFETVDGYPNIAQVRKEPKHKTVVGSSWHTDHSYDQIPAKGSILYAKEVPSSGGDTLFASMYLAYDTLSPGFKETLEGLTAIHSSRHTFSKSAVTSEDPNEDRYVNSHLATQDARHPVIITHPDSGTKALYVNPDFTVKFDGWTEEESAPMLEYLYQHASQAEFVMRFQWQKGSIAFWDNRATWHQAQNDYPGERRLMHRITLEGAPLS